MKLWHIRTFLGNMMGSLESWLLLRSLRTLHLRIPRQSANATGLAQWLSKAASVCVFCHIVVAPLTNPNTAAANACVPAPLYRPIYVLYVAPAASQGKTHDGIPAGVIEKVWHSSLQGVDARGFDPATQLEGGHSATFALFVSLSPNMPLTSAIIMGADVTPGGRRRRNNMRRCCRTL